MVASVFQTVGLNVHEQEVASYLQPLPSMVVWIGYSSGQTGLLRAPQPASSSVVRDMTCFGLNCTLNVPLCVALSAAA